MMGNQAQKAKEFFLNQNYNEALNAVRGQMEYMSADEIPFAYDMLACCYFMLGKFKEALQSQNFAIQMNADIVDFYINKGAILRYMNDNQKALFTLLQVSNMVQDPAVNYNLKFISKTKEQTTVQAALIMQKQYLNTDYEKFYGLVPSFLKAPKERSDYIYAQEQQLVKLILDDNFNKNTFKEHFNAIDKLCAFRESLRYQFGVLYRNQNKKLITVVKNMINLTNNIQNNIQLKDEKQDLMNKMIDLFIEVKKNYNQKREIDKEVLNDITKQYGIKSKKQLCVYKNEETFKQAIKPSQNLQHLCQRSYAIGNHQQKPQINMVITQQICFIYLEMDFIRCLTPTKSLQILKSLPVKTSKILFNLYWFICLRILFNHPSGVNINQLLLYRKPLQFIYQQIDNANQYMISSDKLINETIEIFEQYNKIFSINQILDQTRKFIYENCQKFKNCLSVIDENYESVLKKQIYIDALTTSENTDEQQYFRNTFNLHNQLNDTIVEDLTLIFLKFGKQFSPIHDLLIQAFPGMAMQSAEEVNGKNVFFRRYYELHHPPPKENFLKKMLRKISS